jgi:hypothetical protein
MESSPCGVTSLAIDLAKNVFQLHGTDAYGKAVLQNKCPLTLN